MSKKEGVILYDMNKDIWTDRQVMLGETAFEFHHYLDDPPPKVEFHQHPFYELFFFLSGNVDYTIEGKTYKLRPGDILLTNSLDIHRPEIYPGKPYERIVVWLEDRFFDQIRANGDDLAVCFADAARKDYRRVRPDQASLLQMRTLCKQISQAQKSQALGSNTLVYAYLFEFLVEVCRCYFGASDTFRDEVTEDEKINSILNYINRNISINLSLDTIADTFYISKFYLSKQFKYFTGISVYQYIIKKRVTISRDMLRNGASVTTACMECGFNDYSNYLKAFKREFGCNPGKFGQAQHTI